MRCEKAKKLIVDYVYQELSERQKKKLEEHLSQCWGCSFELESLQKTINLVKSQAEEKGEQFWKKRWRNIEKRLPRSKAALKNKSTFGRFWDWFLNRVPSPGWLFHEFIMRKALPVFGALIVIVCASLFVRHILRTKPEGQDALLSSAEQSAKEGVVLGLPKQSGQDIQVGFYILEHERAFLKLASMRDTSLSSQPEHRFFLRRDDLLYYDMAGGERPESGLIMRGRSDWGESTDQKVDELKSKEISDLNTISLEEAQKLVSFKVVAPHTVASSYTLTGVRKVKDSECVQLLYSNGTDVFSLFQQPTEAKERLDRLDFREYIVGIGKDGERTAVLGWYTDELVFNLVGKADLPRTMKIADEIREYYLMDGVKEYYMEHIDD